MSKLWVAAHYTLIIPIWAMTGLMLFWFVQSFSPVVHIVNYDPKEVTAQPGQSFHVMQESVDTREGRLEVARCRVQENNGERVIEIPVGESTMETTRTPQGMHQSVSVEIKVPSKTIPGIYRYVTKRIRICHLFDVMFPQTNTFEGTIVNVIK